MKINCYDGESVTVSEFDILQKINFIKECLSPLKKTWGYGKFPININIKYVYGYENSLIVKILKKHYFFCILYIGKTTSLSI